MTDDGVAVDAAGKVFAAVAVAEAVRRHTGLTFRAVCHRGGGLFYSSVEIILPSLTPLVADVQVGG